MPPSELRSAGRFAAAAAGTFERTLAASIVGYVLVLRLLYAAQVELLPEETYYWNYSRHLDIGYLDHPPMVAWLIRAGTWLFGNTELGVRFGAICCGSLAALYIYRLARNLYGDTSALAAVVLCQALPFFFLSGVLMTPDAPLTAAWAASLYHLERAIVGEKPLAWPAAGIAVGLGLLSKYTIVLLALSAVVFVLFDSRSRRALRGREPYAAALIAAAVFSPVLIWNAQHEWASFLFQTSRRLAEAPRFSLHKLIGGALVLITPVGLAAVASACIGMLPADRASRFLRTAVLVPMAVFLAFSLRHEVKLDWTGAPWTAALPLLAHGFVQAGTGSEAGGRWLRWAWGPTILALLAFYGGALYYLAIGIPGVGYTHHTELVPVGWREFGLKIGAVADDLRATYGDRLLVVGLDRYAIASELAFYSSDQRRSVSSTSSGHLFGGVGLMYERWFPVQMQQGRPMLLVAWDAADLEVPEVGRRLKTLGPIEDGVLLRDGVVIRHYHYRLGQDYAYP